VAESLFSSFGFELAFDATGTHLLAISVQDQSNKADFRYRCAADASFAPSSRM